MSVTNQDVFNSSTANGVTTVFPYNFRLLDADDLAVLLDGVEVSSGFTVSGIGDANGGSITFDVAPENGVEVLRRREVPLQRLSDYQFEGQLSAESLNREFDRLWMAMQDIKAEVDLKPGLPVNAYPGVDFTIPPPVNGGYWRWKDDGSAIEYVTFINDTSTPVSPYAATLLLADDAEEARDVLDTPSTAEVNAMISAAVASALYSYQQNIHYPVGSEYRNYVDDTSPATILGFGTWVRVDGVFTVGRKSGDTEFGTLGATGGNKTKQLSANEIPLVDDGSASLVSGTVIGSFRKIVSQTSSAFSILPPYVVVSIWKRTA
jgi:hypothetical protein